MKLIQIFARYTQPGGEEKSVDRIFRQVGLCHAVQRCLFHNADWSGTDAPGKVQQAIAMLYNRVAIDKIRAVQDSFPADAWLVHNVYPIASAGVYCEARRRNIPIIQYIHNFRPFSVNGALFFNDQLHPESLSANFFPEIFAGSWQGSRLKTAWLAFVLKWLKWSGWLDSVKAWIAISEFMRTKFIEAGIPADRIHTLRHSWDLINSEAKPTEGKHFLFLGRLTEEKGIRVLLAAWKILNHQLGHQCPELVIAGSGPLEHWLKGELTAVKCIRHIPHVEGAGKDQLLRESIAVLVPSVWWEPLGLVVYEAYDYGKPVLAAASGGLTETVAHGQTGFLHEPGNAAELAAHVRLLLKNPDSERKMGLAGRDWLVENTGTAQWQAGFDQILQSALGANAI